MQKQTFSLAVGALLLSAGAVSAATLTDNLNLRSGPGLSFDVIGAMPAGSDVRVLNCGPSWCRVVWNDTTGFASRTFISSGGPITAAASSTAIVAPRYDYGYGYAQTRSSSWAPDAGVRYGYAAPPSTVVVAPSYEYGYAQTRSSSWAPDTGVGYGYAAPSPPVMVAPSYDGYGYAQTRSSSWAPNPGVGYGGWGYSRYYGYR
jgi:Bacterial SH3 domain